jgi:hypothetical protein
MKVFICALLICVAVSPATAGNSREMLRDRLTFKGQFIIEEPDTALERGLLFDDCCFDGQIDRAGTLHFVSPQDMTNYRQGDIKGEPLGN